MSIEGVEDIEDVVIVGAGLAGAKTAEALRERGFAGTITLVGDEEHAPYERPGLSKGFLAGSTRRSELDVHDRAWYDDHAIALRLGTTVTGLDRDNQTIRLDDGSTIGYDALVLATGSTPRRLPVPGADAPHVLTLRRVEDSERIGAALRPGTDLVVVGGGWIGMEVTANARERGVHVTVVEAAELPLTGVLGPELAEVFHRLHLEHGVEFRLGAGVRAITTAADGTADGVDLDDGEHLAADVVVVGIGAMPNIGLAEMSGIDVDSGVLVDSSLRTSDPAVYAVGDIADQEHPSIGGRVRVEHWANALNQPATAAAAIVGAEASYDELPYFYTDQYDLAMEYLGYAPPGSYADVVIRGDLDGREFVAFWVDPAGRVLAGMNVNVWDVVDDVKALIRAGQQGLAVDRDRLADPAVALSDLV